MKYKHEQQFNITFIHRKYIVRLHYMVNKYLVSNDDDVVDLHKKYFVSKISTLQ